ncbi:MAG: TonB-dependent receptor [Aliidongia sp.]
MSSSATLGGFDHPDSVRIAGDADSDANPTQGAYSVSSGYAELNIPVLKDAPFVKSLTLDASARYDYYTSFGRALTWKTSVDYAITDDFRFRGSDSTGFPRAADHRAVRRPVPELPDFITAILAPPSPTARRPAYRRRYGELRRPR